MTRYSMTVDLERCLGCEACIVSCAVENEVPIGAFRLRKTTTVGGRFPELRSEYRMEQCFQCEESPCVDVCPTGANSKTDDGIVHVDRDRCIGCKACVVSCPYGMRYMHPDGYADKCTFCEHRVREGRQPACVETCPTGARAFGDLEASDGPLRRSLDAADGVVQLRPETRTQPRVFYTNPTLTGSGLGPAPESEWRS